ncbi:hypothetical protein D9M72_528270 [compost metagenome]
MAMRRPLTLRLSCVGIVSRSTPSSNISPELMRPGGMSIRFMIAEEETDLPDPLSPRIARVSPRSRW